jgi:NADPH:quinone reductase-like Zn-dependent oxidoreductase
MCVSRRRADQALRCCWAVQVPQYSLDLVYDTVGDSAAKPQALQALKQGGKGKFITIAQLVFPWDSWVWYAEVTPRKFTMRFGADNLKTAVDMHVQGTLKTEIQQVFSLTEWKQAFDTLKTARVQGKLVFNIYQE